MNWSAAKASLWNRWCDRPDCWTRRSKCGRARTRSTTCWTRSGNRAKLNERVLVTTLTKRMAEELTEFMGKNGVKCRYIHSEVETLDRIEILRQLRLGMFDVLVGVNLLREGLDLPEVSLVAVIDADKEGFLRSNRSLTQTAGRAARNVNGKVIFYADKITDSMRTTMEETERRRAKQVAYNEEHGITPTQIVAAARGCAAPDLHHGHP